MVKEGGYHCFFQHQSVTKDYSVVVEETKTYDGKGDSVFMGVDRQLVQLRNQMSVVLTMGMEPMLCSLRGGKRKRG